MPAVLALISMQKDLNGDILKMINLINARLGHLEQLTSALVLGKSREEMLEILQGQRHENVSSN